MPELPEVETVKRIIEPQLQGRSIEEVLVRRPEVIAVSYTHLTLPTILLV